MDDLALLVDLHRDGARQGPGGDAETRLAIALSGLGDRADLWIADVGSGTGASTLVLADALDGRVTAVDLVPEFLVTLEEAAARHGLADRITTLRASMDALPFDPGSLDAIWSEGAVYSMGFAAGVEAWRAFLRAGGVLAVSELTWLTADRPTELQDHWDAEYPEVATASDKIAAMEQLGSTVAGYFPLPESCWLDGYYGPLRERFPRFLERHRDSDAARAIVAAEEAEIRLYERYRGYVGYGYYVARWTGGSAGR
ncbi:MAG: class I SAM-dependent methyltransferase [Planctomycetota bacterium]